MFTPNKSLHSLEVANFMRTWAGKLNLDSEEAWLVGWLHDIGYINGSKGHAESGAELVGRFNTTLSKYVKAHDSTERIKDDMEFLLRLADFVIDETGKYVGIDTRIKSINLRTGYRSNDILESQKQALYFYALSHCYEDIYTNCL